jgi:predicted dehydrogenase
LYILINLNQQKPIAITAWMQPLPIIGAAERSVHLFLEFKESTAILYLTWEASHRYNAARIYGTKGNICIEDDTFCLTTHSGSKKTVTFPSALSIGSHHPEWFDRVIQGFLYEIRHPEHRGKALEEVYTCLELTLMAYASARKGNKRISLSET